MSMCYSPQLQRQMRYDPLPLRSSQSIEHKQQIKYWSCLLGSTFFYYRNTISSVSSCYSYRHTNETTRCVKMYPWRNLERERSLPTYPAEVTSLCWLTDWLGRQKGGMPHQSCRNLGPITQNHPRGPIRKARTNSLTHRSIKLYLHWLQKRHCGYCVGTALQTAAKGERSKVLFSFLKREVRILKSTCMDNCDH